MNTLTSVITLIANTCILLLLNKYKNCSHDFSDYDDVTDYELISLRPYFDYAIE